MSGADNYHAWIMDLCRPYVSGRSAEVGAGTGTFTRLLAQAGLPEVKAFEPAETLFPALKERVAGLSSIEAINGLFPRHDPGYRGFFDTVFYINVLEHIPDDAEELSSTYESLVPGGKLVVFVPALSWLYGSHDREVGHCRRYHKRQLIALAEAAGYRMRLARYFDLPGILPWFVLFRLLKTRMQGGQVDLYDRFAVPLVRRMESLITPPIGKNLLLIAQKPKT